MDFRKQWLNLPFFSEKEQVISFRRLGSWKETTCSMDFRKQWLNLPFFSEKEHVISFRRLYRKPTISEHGPDNSKRYPNLEPI